MSKVTLHVLPSQPPMSFSDWSAMPGSIALDGYISGPTKLDLGTKRLNLNHHEGVDRLSTRATCAQVLMVLRMGLLESFTEQLHIFVSDCDEDVCLSVWLLKHPEMATNIVNPVLNRLVSVTDALDSTGGAYPFPASLIALQLQSWVFQPYRIAKKNGLIAKRDAETFHSIIDSVGHRIDRVVMGEVPEFTIDSSYHVVKQYEGWAIIDETKSGGEWRTGFFADGGRAYVAIRSRGPDTYHYVIGKMSEFVSFNVLRIMEALNHAENLKSAADLWGGSDLVGGSPRIHGSHLSPSDLADIVLENLY